MKTDIFLSGLVSGLTILLGVIAAEWLKRLRDRISYTRRVVTEIAVYKLNYISYLRDHLIEAYYYGSLENSKGRREFFETFQMLSTELRDLSEIPRWPQRNARQIRQAATNFRICLFANMEHCIEHQVLLHQENAEELKRLELELRSATRSKRAYKTTMRDLAEKKAELKAQMLSREVKEF